jgi:hypothetical protein
MTIKVQLTWKDYLNANLLHSGSHPVVSMIGYAVMVFSGCLILVALLLSLMGEIDMSPLMLLFLAGFLFAIPLYRYLFLPWRIRKLFMQQKTLQAPYDYQFNETGLSCTSEFGNSNMPWSTFVRWKEDRELFMLYHSDVMFNMIPKRSFSDPQEIEAFRSHLLKNNITTRNPYRALSFFVYFLLIIALGAMCFTLYGGAGNF